ncbi:MAG: hypothetical protein LBL95_09460 [Deltaproteobacteria bacterium]|jgi:hypothetical protein|nr:hypothetical protein [Deltaproteobacteria bacterium]
MTDNDKRDEIVVRIIHEIHVIQETVPAYLRPYGIVTTTDPHALPDQFYCPWDDGKPPWLRESICRA